MKKSCLLKKDKVTKNKSGNQSFRFIRTKTEPNEPCLANSINFNPTEVIKKIKERNLVFIPSKQEKNFCLIDNKKSQNCFLKKHLDQLKTKRMSSKSKKRQTIPEKDLLKKFVPVFNNNRQPRASQAKPFSLSFMFSLPPPILKPKTTSFLVPQSVRIQGFNRCSNKSQCTPNNPLLTTNELNTFFANQQFVFRFYSHLLKEEDVYETFREYFDFIQEHTFDFLSALLKPLREADAFKTTLIVERMSLFLIFSFVSAKNCVRRSPPCANYSACRWYN